MKQYEPTIEQLNNLSKLWINLKKAELYEQTIDFINAQKEQAQKEQEKQNFLKKENEIKINQQKENFDKLPKVCGAFYPMEIAPKYKQPILIFSMWSWSDVFADKYCWLVAEWDENENGFITITKNPYQCIAVKPTHWTHIPENPTNNNEE